MPQTSAWQWNDPSSWFQGEPPATGAPGNPPPPTGPKPAATPDEAAQAVIARYWRWQAAGAQTVTDDKGNSVAVDPETGKPDPNFPTVAEINAASKQLTTKNPNDPNAAAQAKATLDETLARTAQIQQAIDTAKAKGTTPPATVQPGEGVLQPDGTYSVPVPTKAPAPPGPGKTQAQIDQEAADSHASSAATIARTTAETNNMQSPAQQQADKIAQIQATARAQANAAIAEKQALIDQGIELSAKDQAELKAKLDGIAADAQAQRDQAKFDYEHTANQPNVQAGIDIQKQNADTNAAQAEASRVYQQQQNQLRQAEGQSKALTDQSTAGQAAIKMGVDAGVAPSMGVIQYAFSPLRQAQQLMQQAISSGQVPQSAMPVPRAPQPAASAAGPPQAPLPAPGTQPAYDATAADALARSQ